MIDEDAYAESLAEGEEDFEFLWRNDMGAEDARYHLDCFASESTTELTYPFGVQLAAAMANQYGDPTVQCELREAFNFRNRYLTKPREYFPVRQVVYIAVEHFMMPVKYGHVHERRCIELMEEAIVAIQVGELRGINSAPYATTMQEFCLWMAERRALRTSPWIKILFQYWKEKSDSASAPRVPPSDLQAQAPTKNAIAQKLAMLTDKQLAVYDLIRGDKAQTGKQILKALEDTGVIMEQSTLTTSIIPALKNAGLVFNKRGRGYLRLP